METLKISTDGKNWKEVVPLEHSTFISDKAIYKGIENGQHVFKGTFGKYSFYVQDNDPSLTVGTQYDLKIEA